MVYVTHDQTEALTFADNVVVMYEGEIVQIGTPAELFERPKHTFVGYFIGSPGMNVMPVAVEGGSARLGSQTIELPGAPKVGDAGAIELGIRPEYVRLGRDGMPVAITQGRGYRPPQDRARQPRGPRHRGDRRRGRGASRPTRRSPSIRPASTSTPIPGASRWEAERHGQDLEQQGLVHGAAGAAAGGVLGGHPADDGGQLFGAGHVRQQRVLLGRHRLVRGDARTPTASGRRWAAT